MAQTPDRITINLPARILLDVGGNQYTVADIEMPVVVLVQPGIPPVIQVAPIQVTSEHIPAEADMEAETERLAGLGAEMPVPEPSLISENPRDLPYKSCPRQTLHRSHYWGDFDASQPPQFQHTTSENYWCGGVS